MPHLGPFLAHLGPFLMPRKQASPESGGKAVRCQPPKKRKKQKERRREAERNNQRQKLKCLQTSNK